MADDLIDKCSHLRLEDPDNEIVDIGDTECAESENRIALLLVGKLLTDRNVNFEAFKKTMIQAWSVPKRVVISSIGVNLFVFQFVHWKDKEKIMEGRPWCFDNSLLVLNNVSGSEQPTDVSLTQCPFWVRLDNLPFNCRSNAIVKSITASMGECMDIEQDEFGLHQYRRIKLNLDVTKPLRRFLNIRGKEGKVIKVGLKYERLPFFCLKCGVIGHSERDCLQCPDDEEPAALGWSLRLRATPRKGKQHIEEEVEEIKASRKILFVTKKNIDMRGEVNTGSGINAPVFPSPEKDDVVENMDTSNPLPHNASMANVVASDPGQPVDVSVTGEDAVDDASRREVSTTSTSGIGAKFRRKSLESRSLKGGGTVTICSKRKEMSESDEMVVDESLKRARFSAALDMEKVAGVGATQPREQQ